MVKGILFLSLYAAAGIGSWGAYSYISTEDASFSALSNLASNSALSNFVSEQLESSLPVQDIETAKSIIYLLQNSPGNTAAEDTPYAKVTFKNYEDELVFLQNLKKKQQQILSGQAASLNIEGIGGIENSDEATTENLSRTEQLKKLLSDAQNIQNLINQRQ